MASFFRSLQFIKTLNVQGRRLGCRSSAYCPSTIDTQLPHLSGAQCALLRQDRTYVTKSAFKPRAYAQNTIDNMLEELDQRVRSYQSIYKSHIDKMLHAVTEKSTLSSTQALLLIRCCGEFLSGEKPEVRNSLTDQIWELTKELKVPLDVSHYNALLQVYLENERDFSPVDILMQMKENQIEPNRVTFQRLIKQYCNKGDISGATKILEHMSEKEIPINENIFNSLIKGHSEAGDVANATKILDIMKSAGIEPSSRTYAEILCVHAKKGDIESIRSVFNECRAKDIHLNDKEILDVIYTLAVNQHLDMIDEMIAYLTRGGLYNKDAAACILKLIEKDRVDVAYKLLKTMVRPENRDSFESGGFFLRKLVNSGASPETLIKYCNLLKEDKLHNNPFELVTIHLFTHNEHHLALPVMKYWAEAGGEIREHYFFPIFVAHSKENNLQGLLNTVKSMVFDFKITPNISTIKEYIVPYLVEDAFTNAQTLVNNHLPFANVAHAILLHLLNQSKSRQACDFICSTNLTFRLSMLARPLVRALSESKDVKSIADIVHHQYVMAQRNQTQPSEDKLTPREFSGSVVSKAAIELPPYDTALITEFLQQLRERGVGIDETAAEQVKTRLGSNITPDIENLLSELASDSLEPKAIEKNGNQRNQRNRYNRGYKVSSDQSPDSKMMLIQQHARNADKEAVERLLPQLQQESVNYTAGFCASMIAYYSKADNVEEATKWFHKLKEISSDVKLDKSKILNYAIALVKNKQIDEAMKVLEYPINDVENNRNALCEKLLDTVSDVCPEKLDEFFNTLNAQKFANFVTNAMLNPIIKKPLKAGDVEKTLEKFKWACETFKLTPCKILVMSHLINNEDAKTLKYVTDLSTQVHGEINSLVDLAIAFFECNRPHQARKILETPGLRLTRERMRAVVEKYYVYDEARLEGFIQLLNGLFLDMDPFYVLLLKSYGKKDDWEKCIALWTQLQEDNIQPSAAFMEELERILKQCNQQVPFASSQTVESSPMDSAFEAALVAQNFEQAEKLLNEMPPGDQRSRHGIRLTEAYLAANNLDKALSHLLAALDSSRAVADRCTTVIQKIIEKLVETDQFEHITNLFSKLNKAHNRSNVPYDRILNEFYMKQGKYNEFLSHLEKLLDDPNRNPLTSHPLFHATFNTSVLLEHPEYLENIKNYAFKALKAGYYAPLTSVWAYYFVKGDPEADVIYNQHLSSTKYFQPLIALYSCKDHIAWEKIPKLMEIVVGCAKDLPTKRKTVFQIFKQVMDSNEPKKYEIAYETLRHMVKIVPVESIKEKYLTELKTHLPDNLSLDSLKSENDREKKEATG